MHDSYNFYEGEVLLINKPYDWTSFDVVNKMRNLIQRIGKKKLKVGHAGTLDPLATGLLIVCTGKETKNIERLQNLPKTYKGTFTLGKTTPSFDGETLVDNHFETSHLNLEILQNATKHFLGKQEQMPPIYSAIKQKGKPVYELARKGKEVQLEPRAIEITSFEITDYQEDVATFEVVCSKGTYIRSLANDFGKYVNSGAFLSSLERSAIGTFLLDNALTIDQFEHILNQTNVTLPGNESV